MQTDQDFLVQFDLGQPRTPEELQQLCETIGRYLCDSMELRKVAHWGSGLWKKYDEEVRPLALFVRPLIGRPGVMCVPNLLDDKNYDAVIRFPPVGRCPIGCWK